MADWIDTLGDAIFCIAEHFMDTSRPKRLLGVSFVAVTAFGTFGTLIAIARGANLSPVGYYVLIPLFLTTAMVAIYCFITDRVQ
jgi:hypothetical protein